MTNEVQPPVGNQVKPNRLPKLINALLNKLICGEKALVRQKRFWIALPIIYFVVTWIWPIGWMRWHEQARIAQADIPGLECNAKHQPRSVSAGFGRGPSLRTSGLETHPVTGSGDTILSDPACLVSVLNGMLYYKGKWVLGISDPRTGEPLFTIIKHPTPDGRPAHEGRVKKP